jgi:O-Antigen ligase
VSTTDTVDSRRSRTLTELLLRLVPTALVVAGACVLAWRSTGSIAATDWLPYAVGAGLLLAVLLASGAAVRPPALGLGAVAGMVALAGWAALSLRWSAVPSLARDEALLTALYAVVLCVPLLTLRTATGREAAAGVVAATLAGLAVATAIQLRVAAHPTDFYFEGRLVFPVSYANAGAAMFLVGFWPAVAAAASARVPPVLRAGALAGATSLGAGWLLSQSKGGAAGVAVSAVVFFAVCPERLRALVPALVAAGLTAAAYRPLTAPFRADGEQALEDAIRHAGVVLLVLVAVSAAVGAAYVLADRLLTVPPRVHRVVGVVVLAAVLATAIAGVATFVTEVDRPGHYLAEKWRSFKRLPGSETGSSHLLTLGSNRYDFWRLSVETWKHHPWFGIGARGFGPLYLQHGSSVETPARAHSLEADELVEGGLVAVLLLVAALGLPLAAAARRARSSIAASGLLAAAVYWIVHSAVDWIWTIPAVSVPAILLLGIGAASNDGRPLSRAAAWLGALAAIAVALLVFAPPWLSTRFTSRAYDASPAAAADDLHWARRLDPLSVEPYLAQAALARRPATAVPPLRRAVRKEPRVAELRYLLGRALLDAGRRAEARRQLRAALRLYPRYDLAGSALRTAR